MTDFRMYYAKSFQKQYSKFQARSKANLCIVFSARLIRQPEKRVQIAHAFWLNHVYWNPLLAKTPLHQSINLP